MTLTQHLLALLARVSIGLWSGLRAEPQLSDLSSNRFCSWCHLEDSTLTEGQRSPISQESFGENDCQFLGIFSACLYYSRMSPVPRFKCVCHTQ